MDKEAVDVLWQIFGYIGTNWGTADSCKMPQTQFDQALAWQVARDSNYQGYYQQTVAEYSALLAKYGSSQQAIQVLLQENQLPSPKLPDVANYVLLELMRWNAAFGGFSSFGYQNYNGWMGGGSFLNVPPPYRALPDSQPTGAHHA